MNPAGKQLLDAATIAFAHFYHNDHANAAIHGSGVRYSPITFRLAEAIAAQNALMSAHPDVMAVLEHQGAYEEDRGR